MPDRSKPNNDPILFACTGCNDVVEQNPVSLGVFSCDKGHKNDVNIYSDKKRRTKNALKFPSKKEIKRIKC